ncbi:MAG: LuxR C-terminal-related transcriptional regulator [Chloroflexota bacterium]
MSAENKSPLPERSVGRRLTDRQSELMRYVAEGLGNKQIAQLLGIAEQTVKGQVSSLLRRLAVTNRAALAEVATEMRIFGTTVDETWRSHLFTQAPFGIAVMRGPDHRVEVANEYYRRNASAPEVVGLTIRDAFAAWETGAFALFDRVYQSGESLLRHEYPARLRSEESDAEASYFDLVIHPLRDAQGAVNGLLHMYIDVTEVVRSRGPAK